MFARFAKALAAAGVVGAIFVPAGHAQLPICQAGQTPGPYCQAPPPALGVAGVKGIHPNVCTRTAIHLGASIVAGAGVRRVVLRIDGRLFKSQTSGAIKLTIPVKGLKPGVHTLSIAVTDKTGRTVTRVLHFRICRPRPAPKFTG